jgi:hypothetical protein
VTTKTITKFEISVEVLVHTKILISGGPRTIMILFFPVSISANNKTKITADISEAPKPWPKTN